MRVLHVIPSIGPARGGPSAAVRLMASACARAGLRVDVASTNDNDRALLDVPLGVPVESEGARYFHFARDMHPYTVSRDLAAWVRKSVTDYDIVHIHALFSYASTVSARAARRRGVPYILRPLGTLAHYGMAQHPFLKAISWRLFESGMIAHAAAIHFTSEAERSEARRLMPMNGEVVPLGIDVSSYAVSVPKGGTLQLLFLSRIHPKKKLELVLRAMGEVPGVTMVVAGAGDSGYVAELMQLAAELGLGDRVEWAGHVEGEAKTRALANADAFVLSSFNENFGIAVVEALASGLPVIVSGGVAIHREVEIAEAGLIADDEAAAVQAMRVLMNAEVRRRMSANARMLAERSFSIDAMATGLIGMYERAAVKR